MRAGLKITKGAHTLLILESIYLASRGVDPERLNNFQDLHRGSYFFLSEHPISLLLQPETLGGYQTPANGILGLTSLPSFITLRRVRSRSVHHALGHTRS